MPGIKRARESIHVLMCELSNVAEAAQDVDDASSDDEGTSRRVKFKADARDGVASPAKRVKRVATKDSGEDTQSASFSPSRSAIN